MGEQRKFKVNNFDLLRLLAATQVIIDHYFQHLDIKLSHFSKEILYLFPGVPVFFIISGYLISASYERNENLSVYLRNRALRILPGLWGCIFITVIVISLTGVSFVNKQTIVWLPCQLIGIIYTPAFLANYGFGSYNGSLWTIPIELQFYILLPLLYGLIPKPKNQYWFYALLFVFVVLNVAYGLNNSSPTISKLLRYSFIPHFYLFLLGVILQRLQIFNSKFVYNQAFYWISAYLLFSLLLNDFIQPVVFLIFKNILLSFCIISMAYTLPTTAFKLLRTNDISYGIYIYHGLILTVLVQLKLVAYENLYFIIGITFSIAWLSWICIEKPFIKRKKKTIRVVA
ncbi:MAG: acyltransferase family protein [Bacteroidia bacterium]